ncbi:hypothetical protein RB595_006323 [Gaeumannomyces hyphopodioides]
MTHLPYSLNGEAGDKMVTVGAVATIPEAEGTLLLFGPQALHFDADAFNGLRALVQSKPNDAAWVADVVASLPETWASFVEAFPQYGCAEGAAQSLEDLKSYFAGEGNNTETEKTQPPTPPATRKKAANIILSPLVVISHLIEHGRYVDATAAKPQRVHGALGFCTGLLSAFAVSASRSREELQEWGANAVRLAMVIGGVVDAQEVLDPLGTARALAVGWNSSDTGDRLKEVLDKYPEQCYISVAYDGNRATVTAAAQIIEQLQRDLSAVGITASEIGLHGRFHHAWYEPGLADLADYCGREPGLRLPDACDLAYPTWSNAAEGSRLLGGSLHEHALRALLVTRSSWYHTFRSAWSSIAGDVPGGNDSISLTSFGPERCVPPSVMRKSAPPVLYMADFLSATTTKTSGGVDGVATPASPATPQPTGTGTPTPRKDDDVAVIGLSIKVAGADDADEFWDLLCSGESQHQEVPPDRLSFDNVWREQDPDRKWFGNFVRDHDAFDHKFFKKSAREMQSTDPQQRLMLQAAYQAVEQSGYFGRQLGGGGGGGASGDRKIGCYIGVCSADYENNMACYQPNAFTAIGNLKSFIAGKVSHWFGWLGPSMCIDTACSSSLVAVHYACRAILSGECSAALAGGANIMTNSLWFQNLAAASFLSPTGQCKPFDAAADGYCRGEGFAAVMLKKMSAAIADGDQILGTISATAVLQNQNCTPVFVPNAPSLADLFRDVVRQSRLEPDHITVAEAHGTGTQVGDPAEYAGLRDVLAGPRRSAAAGPLALGSVKGLVGHTECASGAVSLVKTLLMVQHRMVPPQVSFGTMNPGVGAKPEDRVEIVTRLRPWDVPRGVPRAAIINNYGASGSNASIVVTEAPTAQGRQGVVAAPSSGAGGAACPEYPVRIFGHDERALKAYASRLLRFLASARGRDESAKSMANLAFNLCRQSNPTLDRSLVLGAKSAEQLAEKLSSSLEASTGGGAVVVSQSQKQGRPVILCFGGQVSTFVGLDRQLYESAALLRQHLSDCDVVCRSLPEGAGSIFPAIFQRTPISDPVKLQTMLFAAQYSCAKSWIDSGVAPAALVGHSFGELVALCVSGALSLHDALKLVAGRARVIRESWGVDSGAMMAVEGDRAVVERLLAASGGKATIACYNGPTSFTLAGTTAEIEEAAETLARPPFSSMRSKKLNVTNAFHSTLVEALIPQLVAVGTGVRFREPVIPLEHSVEHLAPRLDAQYVADHMRKPVFFNQALQRLAARFPAAVFLEAGFNSSVTAMANRALGAPKASRFQALNITGDGANGLQALTSATLSLWKGGVQVDFWPYHRLQTSEYLPLLLPPYQFDKSRHWMEMKAPPRLLADRAVSGGGQPQPEASLGLFSFLEYTDKAQRSARFRINTSTEKYRELVSGHKIASTAAICPATVIVDMAIEALTSIRPELSPASTSLQPQIHDVKNQAAICIDDSRTVFLEYLAPTAEAGPGASSCRAWDWKIASCGPGGPGDNVVHATGRLLFVAGDDAKYQADFRRLERLTGGHAHCAEVLDSGAEADDILQGGRSIYRAFAGVVDYAEPYHGLQRLVGKGLESAGRVIKRHDGGTWLGAHISDCFSQVGGIWVNCMTDCKPGDMYIATGFEQWMRSPEWATVAARLGGDGQQPPAIWDVLARHEKSSENAYLTDIFVFESEGGRLTEAILGINYHRVSKASMGKMLARMTPGLTGTRADASAESAAAESKARIPDAEAHPSRTPESSRNTNKGSTPKNAGKTPSQPVIDVEGKIRLILADICGLEPAEITMDSGLAEIGIDSLMGMELGREMEGAFKKPLMSDALAQVTTLRELVTHVAGVLGVSTGDSNVDVSSDSGSAEHGSGNSALSTTVTSVMDSPPSPDDHAPASTKPQATGVPVTELELSPALVFEAFEETKCLTDKFIADYRCGGYVDTVMPRQTRLCVALAVEAFAQLGCDLGSAKPGTVLPRIPHAPEHERLTEWLYTMLSDEARLLDLCKGPAGETIITRTAVSPLPESSEAVLAELVRDFPDHDWANRLTFFAGRRLADVVRGEQDGIGLIFGTDEGRELVKGLYGDSLLNKLANAQMRDILARLVENIKARPGGWGGDGPLRVMELGAGTGGTTKDMVPMLASLGVPVEYTFTDLAGSFVAAARKTLGKTYPFMKFRVHDIEKEPAAELLGTQHVVIASNAIHATRSLAVSLANVRKSLRPDGFLMMLEMTTPVHWVDVIFGLFEGWWLFEDGRRHAIAHQTRWRQDLTAAGYGRLDWTDGWRPEVEIQRVMVAQASVVPGFPVVPSPMIFQPPETPTTTTTPTQEAQIDQFVRKYSAGFDLEPSVAVANGSDAGNVAITEENAGIVVAVTGATGSLGSHLVAHLASMPAVKAVYCLNRRSRTGSPDQRQDAAFSSRGITLGADEAAKLRVLVVDGAKPRLGLATDEYETLAKGLTHIVHNAWTMSGKRPVSGFEDQFRAMRGLVDLARDAQALRCGKQQQPETAAKPRTTFVFVSSIAVMGHHPLIPGNGVFAPEERLSTAAQMLPNGYAHAKWACERILEATLHRFPDSFRACSVRPGQIAGHSQTGCWNDVEHLAFLVKSSQTLAALPALDGDMCWTPVDTVAGTLADLLVLAPATEMEPVYHIDNPVRQPWSGVLQVLAAALPPAGSPGPLAVVPFDEWVRRVRSFPGTPEDNPAVRLADFLDENFVRMSCGGMLLDTQKCCRHSPTLSAQGPVSVEVAKRYLDWWKLKGFLQS